MGLQRYLAGTAKEIFGVSSSWGCAAFLGCHFAPYNNGLMVLEELPRCDMVILSDRIPVLGHDPDTVTGQLREILEQAGADCVLLDFQRAENPQTAAIVKAAAALPCPVAVTAGYGHCSEGPVFVEIPMHRPLTDAAQQWPGRELWLDVAGNTQQATVTAEGAVFTSLPPALPHGLCHRDEALHCSYRIRVLEDWAEFTLFRTKEDMDSLLQEAEALGFAKAIGLYQELQTVLEF